MVETRKCEPYRVELHLFACGHRIKNQSKTNVRRIPAIAKVELIVRCRRMTTKQVAVTFGLCSASRIANYIHSALINPGQDSPLHKRRLPLHFSFRLILIEFVSAARWPLPPADCHGHGLDSSDQETETIELALAPICKSNGRPSGAISERHPDGRLSQPFNSSDLT